jgi:soluble P-type ATPase
MLEVVVPNLRTYLFRHIIFDYNGTIAFDGMVLSCFVEHVSELSSLLNVHVITADTFGSVQQQLAGLPCHIHLIDGARQAEQKQAILHGLDASCTIAVGNGQNDALMLKDAVLGIAVCGAEGLATVSGNAADLIVPSLDAIFGLLAHPRRLIATLRI